VLVQKKRKIASMVFDMCSEFSKKMEGMVQGIASMDDAEASTVAGSRKRLCARE
jgi:hypothetical protein